MQHPGTFFFSDFDKQVKKLYPVTLPSVVVPTKLFKAASHGRRGGITVELGLELSCMNGRRGEGILGVWGVIGTL